MTAVGSRPARASSLTYAHVIPPTTALEQLLLTASFNILFANVFLAYPLGSGKGGLGGLDVLASVAHHVHLHLQVERLVLELRSLAPLDQAHVEDRVRHDAWRDASVSLRERESKDGGERQREVHTVLLHLLEDLDHIPDAAALIEHLAHVEVDLRVKLQQLLVQVVVLPWVRTTTTETETATDIHHKVVAGTFFLSSSIFSSEMVNCGCGIGASPRACRSWFSLRRSWTHPQPALQVSHIQRVAARKIRVQIVVDSERERERDARQPLGISLSLLGVEAHQLLRQLGRLRRQLPDNRPHTGTLREMPPQHSRKVKAKKRICDNQSWTLCRERKREAYTRTLSAPPTSSAAVIKSDTMSFVGYTPSTRISSSSFNVSSYFCTEASGIVRLKDTHKHRHSHTVHTVTETAAQTDNTDNCCRDEREESAP